MKKILILLLVLLTFSCTKVQELADRDAVYIEERNALLEAGKSQENSFKIISRFSNEDFRDVSIVLDENTGVKYLYTWGGTGNGGPAITRYWEK